MDKSLYRRVREFCASAALVREMLDREVINDRDMVSMDAFLAGLNGLKKSTIFSEIDLITGETYDNMRYD